MKMTNLEKYNQAFAEALDLEEKDVNESLEYQGIESWDSIGHMELISQLEDMFGIMLDTDDIVDLSSYNVGKEILAKYDIIIE
jgi:acyl carrier protein